MIKNNIYFIKKNCTLLEEEKIVRHIKKYGFVKTSTSGGESQEAEYYFLMNWNNNKLYKFYFRSKIILYEPEDCHVESLEDLKIKMKYFNKYGFIQ